MPSTPPATTTSTETEMKQLSQSLLNCNLERFILEPAERLLWIAKWKRAAIHLRKGALGFDTEVIDVIRRLSYEQMMLARSVLGIEALASKEISEMAEAMAGLEVKGDEGRTRIRKWDDDGEASTHIWGPIPAEEPDEHLRDWYVSNLSYPFPDKPSKHALATPINYSKEQLNTWFTNMRRRSGYTEHLRTFAGGNKRRFEEMITAVMDGQVGKGAQGLVEAVEDMRKYVAKKPRGKVGEWLLTLMEGEEKVDHIPRKKRRVVLDTTDDLKPSTSEQPLAPETIEVPTAEASTTEAPTTSIAKSKIKANKAATPKTIKTYRFSIGASDSPTPSSNTKRRPLGSPFRTSQLRTVSTNSTSSLETVDSGLGSISGVSAANSMSSNISSDLNFSFPTYNVNTPQIHVTPREIPTVILTPPAPRVDFPPVMHQQQYHQPSPQQQQTLYTFGMQENSQFTFNPHLPHTVQLAPAYHPAISYNPSYQQNMFYPSSQPGAAAFRMHNFQRQQQQEYVPYQGSAELRFSDGFGTTMTMKRNIGEVGGLLLDERAWKVPRFEEV